MAKKQVIMTKILYIITQSEFGGAQHYVFDLATNLNKSQYEVHIAHGGQNNGIFASLEGQNLAIHSLKHLIRSISPITDIKAYFELKNLIKQVKPDIVNLNSSKVGVLGSMAAKASKVPKIIYTAHGFVFNEPLNPITKWIYKLAELFNSKRVNKIITVSEYDKQTGIKAGIPEKKMTTIHNGVNPVSYLSKDDARAKLNIASDKPIIGCIANFYHTKGVDILIQAMTKVDAHLIIIGNGHLRDELDEQIKKLDLQDKITLLGSIDNASQYLKAFDLFALASRKEGLSYTLLEAQAAQIPIVATKVGGTPEIIQHSINGYLAQAENPDDLADKINQAIKKPLASNLTSDFTLDNMVSRTIAVYNS